MAVNLFHSGTKTAKSEAIQLFQKAANQGHKRAQFDLAICLFKGDGTERNEALAFDLMRQLAEKGFGLAKSCLGYWLMESSRGNLDIQKEGIKLLREGAEIGHVTAQRNLGNCLLFGIGISRDVNEGLKWSRMAAEQGSAAARCDLGDYLTSEGATAKEEEEGIMWLGKAALQGHVAAQCNLGVCLLSADDIAKREEGIMWLRRAAEEGETDAEFNLGICLVLGNVVPRDEAEGITWLSRAAEKGHDSAQYNLGMCLINDRSTARYKEGITWLRKTAEKGHADAQRALGTYQIICSSGTTAEVKEGIKLRQEEKAGKEDAKAQIILDSEAASRSDGDSSSRVFIGSSPATPVPVGANPSGHAASGQTSVSRADVLPTTEQASVPNRTVKSYEITS